MPALHKYIGNPFLTWVLNKLFGAGISHAQLLRFKLSRVSFLMALIATVGIIFLHQIIYLTPMLKTDFQYIYGVQALHQALYPPLSLASHYKSAFLREGLYKSYVI